MKILVTGHKGLIGSEIYKELEERGHEVQGHDLKDIMDMVKDGKYDFIIHCAASCIIRDVIKDPKLMWDNCYINYDVMELARETGAKVIYFSSNRVSTDCMNPYIVSKRFGEDLCKAYHECYGVDYLIVRPETVWGKNEDGTRVIPNWINKAKNGEDIIVYGNKSKELSPLSVGSFTNKFFELFEYFDTLKNKEALTITGFPRKVGEIIDDIGVETYSDSHVVYKKAEGSQPQKCVSRKKNEFRIGENFQEKVRDYLEN